MRRQNRAEENLRAWVSSAGGFVHPDACLCAEEHQKERKAIVVNTLKAGTVLLKIPVDLCFVGTPTVSAQSELAVRDYLSLRTRAVLGCLAAFQVGRLRWRNLPP